jgi:hypothetical protein
MAGLPWLYKEEWSHCNPGSLCRVVIFLCDLRGLGVQNLWIREEI